MKRQILLIFTLGAAILQGYAQNNVAPSARTQATISNQPYVAPLQLKSTPIWGAGAASGAADGEFQNAFIQTGTATFDPNAWTALSVSQSGSTPGSAYWTRSTTGVSQGAYAGSISPVSSPSASNGVALFDSDFLDNGGVAGAFGMGTSPSPHVGDLVSPRIDLTGYTDSALVVSFFSFYRQYSIFNLTVSFSTDDGATWTTKDYRQYTNNQTEEMLDVVFSDVTDGVVNLTQCRIKFSFDGDYYFAIVDDVSIGIASKFDLNIGAIIPTSNNIIERGDMLQITGTRYIADKSFNENHLEKWGVKVENLGYADVVASDDAKLYCYIQDANAGYLNVYTDSIMVDSISSTGFFYGSKEITDYNWAVSGDYRVVYVAKMDGDANPDNDTVVHDFSIVSNYTSQVDISALTGAPYATQPIAPGGAAVMSWEYGSTYHFAQDMNLDSIVMTYYVQNSFVGVDNQTVIVKVYQLDTLGGVYLDDDARLTQIAESQVLLSNLSSAIGTYGVIKATSFVDPLTSSPITVLPAGPYFISVLIQPSLSGGAATFTASDIPWLGVSTDKNYSLNFTLRGLRFQPATRLVSSTGVVSWYTTGFGVQYAPSIGIFGTPNCSGNTVAEVFSDCDDLLWRDGNMYSTTTSGLTHVVPQFFGCDSIYTLDFTKLEATSSTDVHNECGAYQWIDGNTYNTSNNSATFVVQNAAGCDSTITLDLTITEVDAMTTVTGATITANATGTVAYQWIDCDNGNSAIIGENGASFSPSQNGNYAVIVTENGCSETSACVSIQSVNVGEIAFAEGIQIYPNPTEGELAIRFSETYQNIELSLYDVSGKLLDQMVLSETERLDYTIQAPKGIYTIHLKSDQNTAVFSVIKK